MIPTRLLTLALLIVFAAPLRAVDTPPARIQLPTKLQALLTEEMRAINSASGKILTALVAGDHDTVATQAQAIHDSFILERKLTPPDRAELEQALPADFVALDTQFHARAARLATVARAGDVELMQYNFSRLIETCQICHSRYAVGKFPGFATGAPAQVGHGHAEPAAHH